MKNIKFLLFTLLFLFISTLSVFAQNGKTGLILHSEQGDFVGAGKNYSYQDCPFFRAQIFRRSDTNVVTGIRISYGSVWDITFDTSKINKPLTRGVYLDAQRFPFNNNGHPGLDISGMGRGCNILTGKFTVLDAEYGVNDKGDPTLISFAASFEQNCEAGKPKFIGTVYFNTNFAVDTEQPVISNVTFSKKKLVLSKDSEVQINWKSKDNTNIASYDVLFSVDAINYQRVVSALPADTKSYTLKLSQNTKPTDTGVVKIVAVDEAGNAGEATSDGVLIIK